MYCKTCGKNIEGNAVVCTGCGCLPLSGEKHCQACGETIILGQTVCLKCGNILNSHSKEDELTIRRIADYYFLSSWFWLVLGIIQVICCITCIAGAWNIFAAVTRFKLVDRIKKRDQNIPKEHEDLVGLIIIAVINLVFGGMIGIAFALFDYYIRDLILKNTKLFNENLES